MSQTFYALFCEVDPAKESVRLAIRPQHLAYLESNRERIHFGGPFLGSDGAPETMMLVLNAANAADASAFLTDEPYNRSGVFSSIRVRPWVQVLPDNTDVPSAQTPRAAT